MLFRICKALFLSCIMVGSSLAEPPDYMGIRLTDSREKVMGEIQEVFPQASEPVISRGEKTTIVIYKNPDQTTRKITLHFHPNGKLTGINVILPVEGEEALRQLLPKLGSPTEVTKRGYVWKLEDNYQVSITVFVEGESDLKFSDRAAYDKYGRPWKDEGKSGEGEKEASESGREE